MVCFPGAKIEAILDRVERIMGPGKGGSILVHIETNNTEREGTTATVRKYRQLVRTLMQMQIDQIILSWILLIMGSRSQGYRNYWRMAINTLVQQLCTEEEVGFVGMFC